MGNRYLVETDRKPCCDYGTNDYHFKDAQIVKLRQDQVVVWEAEYEARKYNGKRVGREECLKEGREEAWALARKIAGSTAAGAYDWPTLREIFGPEWSMMKIFDDNYETVKKKISDYENLPKIGDLVRVHSDSAVYDGRLALVVALRKYEDKRAYKVVFDDGDVSLYTYDAVDYVKTVGFEKFFSEEEEEE